jgi:hypothetical protein
MSGAMNAVLPPPERIDPELAVPWLLCNKLVKLLQGAMSIGIVSIAGGAPNPKEFYADRFRAMSAFVEVVRTVSAGPSSTAITLRLRHLVDELNREMGSLHDEMIALVCIGLDKSACRFD